MSSKITQLTELGQSIWFDDMGRRLLDNGDLAKMIHSGDIRGLTSNPSIFNQAIAQSKDYDSALIPLSWAGYGDREILEQLMVEDIQRVADLLFPLFIKTKGGDGFVSLEVRPDYAYDTDNTIKEAQRLWKVVDRPNLMIKIPATKPGLVAIRQSIAAGININVTLIFSLDRYKEVMDAYISGLIARQKAGKPVDCIFSVASFFISRIDSKVDKYLEAIIQANGTDAHIAHSLLGKLAIANARLAYQEFKKVFESDRFVKLHRDGAEVQRPLWASTSTKNPSYPDTMYIDELIGANTVNTVPPKTIDAFRDHGKVTRSIERNLDDAHQNFSDLETVGISMQKVTQELEEEGVQAFSLAFASLLDAVKQRRENALTELGSVHEAVSTRIHQFQADNFSKRLHSMDATLWTDHPEGQEEVAKRMGWLSSPLKSQSILPDIKEFVSDVEKAGYTHALLLGLGGSSLAPEVISLIYGKAASGLKLTILDSTDPSQLLSASRKNPPARTLFIVSSKSGGTAEVNALFAYFWERARVSLGDKGREHFIAITDPNTSLEKIAIERKFRKVFLADPEVGGRFSALTVFGLVPAALMGVDLEELLRNASRMAIECSPDQPIGRNPGIVLGAVLGEAYKLQKDKLTFIADPELAPFGSWLEQLIAESSGKQGKGILPIHGETLGSPDEYGEDRIFVYLRNTGIYDGKVNTLRKADKLVITENILSKSALGAEFYKWEIAISAACSIIGVNPFDQPDVQDSKNRTLEKIAYYKSHHTFDERPPDFKEQGINIFSHPPVSGTRLPDYIIHLLLSTKPGDYIAINAFLKRDKKVEAALHDLRTWIRVKTRLATMVGFGPRFLHSTGQLHKGGANNGIFLVITADPVHDVKIPHEELNFGNLEYGQALGDLEALEGSGRRTMHFHFSSLSQFIDFVKRLAVD